MANTVVKSRLYKITYCAKMLSHSALITAFGLCAVMCVCFDLDLFVQLFVRKGHCQALYMGVLSGRYHIQGYTLCFGMLYG